MVNGQWCPWSMVHGPWSIITEPWSMVHGPWSMVVHGRPWSSMVVHDPWSMVHGPWSMVHGQWSMTTNFYFLPWHVSEHNQTVTTTTRLLLHVEDIQLEKKKYIPIYFWINIQDPDPNPQIQYLNLDLKSGSKHQFWIHISYTALNPVSKNY